MAIKNSHPPVLHSHAVKKLGSFISIFVSFKPYQDKIFQCLEKWKISYNKKKLQKQEMKFGVALKSE